MSEAKKSKLVPLGRVIKAAETAFELSAHYFVAGDLYRGKTLKQAAGIMKEYIVTNSGEFQAKAGVK